MGRTDATPTARCFDMEIWTAPRLRGSPLCALLLVGGQGLAGEGEEHLVEARLTQAELGHADPGRGQVGQQAGHGVGTVVGHAGGDGVRVGVEGDLGAEHALGDLGRPGAVGHLGDAHPAARPARPHPFTGGGARRRTGGSRSRFR
jgi:hypothetical protein